MKKISILITGIKFMVRVLYFCVIKNELYPRQCSQWDFTGKYEVVDAKTRLLISFM